jgi:hypothetical protein
MDTQRALPDIDSAWTRLRRSTAITGLVAVPLLFAPTIAISTLGEPPFDGSPNEISAFFDAVVESGWAPAAQTLQAVGTLTLLWWAVGLFLVLRRAEGDPAWRSTAALVSGAIFTAYVVLEPSWAAASARGALGRDVVVFAFDAGNVGFANSWLALGSFAIGCGWVVVRTGALPVWGGWLAIVSGGGFVVARFVWTTQVWLVPYAGFWVWVIAVNIALLRATGAGLAPAERAGQAVT